MPIGYGHSFYNPRVNWMYQTRPQEALAGRRIYFPRGRLLGGSNSINAMILRADSTATSTNGATPETPAGATTRCCLLQIVRRFCGPASPSAGATGRLRIEMAGGAPTL